MSKEPKPKRGRGRPGRELEPIPDTFENVVKALVTPLREPSEPSGKQGG